MTNMRLLPALLCLLASPALANTGNWHSVDGSSSIGWVANWQGNAVKGSFKKFTVTARGLDPAHPSGASLSMKLDTGSITAASPDITQALHGADWFNISQYPHADFTGHIRQNKGRLEAEGQLQLKGHKKTLDFPLSVTQQGSHLILKGHFEMQRNDFGIGSGQWSSGKTIAFKVQVKYSITLAKDNAGQQ